LKVLVELDTQLQTIDAEIVSVLCEGAWAESVALLTSIIGIGMVTTAWLLVGTLNLQACASAEAAAAYAGLVPLAREADMGVVGEHRSDTAETVACVPRCIWRHWRLPDLIL
jgi:transposase